MMRRKLVLYTCMMIAGITAGYFMLERNRIIEALVFMTALGSAAFLMEGEGGSGRRKRPEIHGNDENYDRLETIENNGRCNRREIIERIAKSEIRFRSVCFSMIMIGFLIFSFNYAYLESAEAHIKTSVEDSEEMHVSISGRIISAEDRGESIRLIIKTGERSVGRNIRVQAGISKSDYEDVKIADMLGAETVISGRIKELTAADNPGCFDYRLYMRGKGIVLDIKADNAYISKEQVVPVWRFKRKLYAARENFLSRFDASTSAMLKGVVFGDKSEIDEEVLREFNMNSTGHILAVSGLHIGFLYAMLRMMSGGRKTLIITTSVILIMILYGEMTMWSSSTVRAVTVIIISILSVIFRRPYDMLSSLASAAFLILLIRPYMLFNSGFQLSFAAMTSIAFLSKPLSKHLGNLIGTSLAVQIGTMPVIASSFYRVNLMAIFINVPIIMLSSVLVPICIFALFADMLIGSLPHFLISVISFGTEALININHSLHFEGAFSSMSAGAGAAIIVTFYILLFVLASEWFKLKFMRREHDVIIRAFSFILVPMLMLHLAFFNPLSDDEIVFLAVGQGDCTHIRCGDIDVLIDGGGSDFINTGEKVLMPYLLSQGVKDIDIAILTHLHKDHYLGIAELSEEYPVNAVAFSEDYRNSYENQAVGKDGDTQAIVFKCNQISYLTYQSKIQIDDGVSIEVIWPAKSSYGDISIDDANEHNMVYMLDYKGTRVMITGDLLEEDELEMIRHYRGTNKLKCDILKVAHHGSKSSSSEEFLDAADPKIAVIQVGRNNLYGHPHRQTLERLEERGIKVYRTDEDGAVGFDCR